ncbi:MAG TPA: HNH endonuclease signature motif containing protein [Dehalococcoidia bacterium]
MLHRDTSAGFVKSGGWVFARYRFVGAKRAAPGTYSAAAFERLRWLAATTPQPVLDDSERRRRWWWFDGEFYWDDDGYDATQVKALILERRGQKTRRVQRAVALMQQTEPPARPERDVIAEAVRLEVWRRDAGRCVSCGSRERLQFDHVIPVHLGGASSLENLQLLCAACNLAKGSSLA